MGTLRLGNDVVVPSVVEKELVNKQKFGASIDNFLGDINSEGVYNAPAEILDFVADGIKSIGKMAFYGTFAYKSIASASFPILTAISDSNACYYMFSYSKLSSASFPVLNTISGENACYSMFSGCSKLSSISFPALTTISGRNTCSSMFSTCFGLISVSFPVLTTISGVNACNFMFSGCTNLTSASFPVLTAISGTNACSSMFSICYNLTSASFPALTAVEHTTCMPANMFQSCNKLTEIHFRADTQTIIEGQSGYASKFGATNATIYFDL